MARVVRQLTCYVLGVLTILEGLYGDHDPLGEVIVGMILLGVLPIDELWRRPVVRRRHERPPDDD